jgi:NADH:ubiquinone oxidoreductase subunit C
MFGIFFLNNQNLQRLLLDYGFLGAPLRKDFPLSGYVEIFYNEKKKKIVYEKIEMTQEQNNIYFYKN